MAWEQPHWSGRPQQQAVPRQRLRPNGFAKMARYSIENRYVVMAVYLLAALLCVGFAAAMLKIDPDQRPLVTLDPQTLAAQSELDKHFPGIDDAFLAICREPRSRSRPRAGRGAVCGPVEAERLVPLQLRAGAGPFMPTMRCSSTISLVYRHV